MLPQFAMAALHYNIGAGLISGSQQMNHLHCSQFCS